MDYGCLKVMLLFVMKHLFIRIISIYYNILLLQQIMDQEDLWNYLVSGMP